MKRKSTFRYEVAHNEEVTIDITAVGAKGGVVAAQNGASIPNSGSEEKPSFSFTVTEDVNKTHFAKLEFSFFGSNPDDARFDIAVRGSNGGSFDDFRPVAIDDSIKEMTFRFKVVAGPAV